MNMAAVERLPMVVVVANNQYAYSTPTCAPVCLRGPARPRAGLRRSLGTPSTAPISAPAWRRCRTPSPRARAGNGPQMVVARLLRLTGHGEHDDASYMDPQLRASAVGGDCLKLARQQIHHARLGHGGGLDAWRAKASAQVDAAIATAQSRRARPTPRRKIGPP